MRRSEVEGFVRDALELVARSRQILQRYSARDRGAARKEDRTLVSHTDLEIETVFRDFIAAKYPDHGVVGEEFPPVNADAEFVWYVDPVDGTEDYLRGMPTYGTIVGLCRGGQPVAGAIDHPALDLCCHAGLGTGTFLNGDRVRLKDRTGPVDATPVVAVPALEDFRKGVDDTASFVRLCAEFPNFRTFRTCYAHVLAVSGGVDAAVEYSVSPWDLAASRILVEEAGGRYIRFRHDPERETSGVVLGRPDVAARIAELLS